MENSFGPMSETAYYILLSLLEERHGYGIMQHVAEISKNRIYLGAGTVYGTIGKLEKGSLIVSTHEEEKRKYYVITEKGRHVLYRELDRLKELYQNGMEALTNGE